jgi:hypothetical protein
VVVEARQAAEIAVSIEYDDDDDEEGCERDGLALGF